MPASTARYPTSVDIAEDEQPTVHGRPLHDDGAGFDTAASSEGYGLVSMRERAQLLHGTLTSGPGEGTTVEATLPVSRRSAAEQAVADAGSESAGRARLSVGAGAAAGAGCGPAAPPA